MAATDVLTSAEAKAVLRQGASTANDTEITALITAVSERLDKAVGPIVTRTITADTYDGTVSGRGVYSPRGDWDTRGVVIQLRSWPVGAITTVTENGTTLASTEYYIDAEIGQLYRLASGHDYPWSPGRDNIAVTYTAGRYADTASVAARYKQGAIMLLQHLWRTRTWSTTGVGTGDFQVPTVAFPAYGIPNAVAEWFGGEWREHKRGGFA